MNTAMIAFTEQVANAIASEQSQKQHRKIYVFRSQIQDQPSGTWETHYYVSPDRYYNHLIFIHVFNNGQMEV